MPLTSHESKIIAYLQKKIRENSEHSEKEFSIWQENEIFFLNFFGESLAIDNNGNFHENSSHRSRNEILQQNEELESENKLLKNQINELNLKLQEYETPQKKSRGIYTLFHYFFIFSINFYFYFYFTFIFYFIFFNLFLFYFYYFYFIHFIFYLFLFLFLFNFILF
jgi:hypothetical protein